jgi:hypothetical protein
MMAKSIIARQAGDEYQDDWFWLQATRLLRAGTPVTAVGYESENVHGFDDVAVFYGSPIRDEFGDQVMADYYQLKFHVNYSGALTARALIDPSFIGNTRNSLLQRVRNIQLTLAPQGKGIRLFFTTPWPIHPDDPLSELVSTQNGEIRIGPLFKGGPRSAMGKLRNIWTTHLALFSDEELRSVLRTLRIYQSRPTQAALREQLNLALVAVGLASAGESLPGNPYHAVIRKLYREGKTRFSGTDLREACKADGLFTGCPIEDPNIVRLGIRSFLRWAEHLEDETDYLLDLLQFFDNRIIRSQVMWGAVLTRVVSFIEEHVRTGNNYRLFLDTHSSIAFLTGYLIDPKCGAVVVPMQRSIQGRVAWVTQDSSQNQETDAWEFNEFVVGEGDDVALAVSVTHDAIHDVKLFVAANLPNVGRIVHARVAGGPSSSAVRSGNHALTLAQQLTARAKQECSTKSANSSVHLFFAAPNGLVFFIGRHSRGLGDCVLYEYDFESNRPGGYRRSLKLPLRQSLKINRQAGGHHGT